MNPARVKRIGAEIPDGYEIADAPGVASPATFWGIRPGWTADPAPCAALVHPADDPAAQGLSGSGTGGLLYVVAVVDHGGVPEPALVAECGHWMLTAGQTVATVTAQPGPAIDGVATFGMSTAIRVVVESGTETDSVAHTFTAYPDGYLVFVTLITDPGSPDPPLPPQFAAELLVKTVAAVRG